MLAVTCYKSLNSLACMDQLRKIISLPIFLMICSIMMQAICAATDTINSSQTLRDGETMISSAGVFELGFFSPGNSENRYVGMWYKNITVKTVIWVANRESPLRNKSGALKITEQGLLVILDDTNGSIFWSSNKSSSSLKNPVAKLQDTGNLVVKDENDDRTENNNFLWQSFDYPTDTYLPGMGLGKNLVTGEETYLSSWRSAGDPAPGDFTCHMDPTGYLQTILKRRNIVQNRLGPWNGVQFSGSQIQQQDPTHWITISRNEKEVMFRVNNLNISDVSRSTISPSGLLQRWSWNYQTQDWNLYYNLPEDNCDTYGLCGPHGRCNIETASCKCLDYRFEPKDSEAWLRGYWSGGCVRRTNLSCQGDVFLKYSGIKMPDARFSWFNESMTLGECREECLRNCSCMAYTQLDTAAGSGCLFYSGDLVDIRDTPPGGQEIYIRMASSEMASHGKKKNKLVAMLVPVTIMVLLGLSLILYLLRRKKNSKMRTEGEYEDSELPLFKKSTILKATNNFSIDNKVGEGGFGPVYKGKLEGGQEIAVKRLSRTSSQGLDELKNEVVLIAKLQHRNLVRLLGCCIEGEESMLVYEYMSNKSLDMILFDKSVVSVSLDWPTRFQIINGIARGLLYLHQDSRLRIIHRDLKASNILLDADMNPKISDFGTARSFGSNETAAKTRRVIGTYGYMAPEYAVDGIFSVKSDVFSFGVLVLEIVGGKKNRGFTHSDHHLNLLGHAWTLYKQERSVEMVDVSLGSSFDLSEALRSIHVGLLCVQKKPEDRPSMSSVVLMLANEGVLPPVNQPGFYTERDILTDESSTSTNATQSTNEATITTLEGR